MFVKSTNGQVDVFPYNIGNLRRDNSNVSFPKVVPETTMAAYNMFPVEHDVDPKFDPLTQKVEVGVAPVLTGGKWVLPKTVVALTAEQISSMAAAKAQSIRTDRDRLLAACDWTQVADAPVDQAAWAVYRQALRDVTAQAGFPDAVVWPTKPV